MDDGSFISTRVSVTSRFTVLCMASVLKFFPYFFLYILQDCMTLRIESRDSLDLTSRRDRSIRLGNIQNYPNASESKLYFGRVTLYV